MKKTITSLLLSSFVFAGQVNFTYKTIEADQNVKNYIVKVLNEKCISAFDDGESQITVTDISVEQIDQGMELEYTAVVKVVADYGHSGAETITLQFDEERYHSSDFYLFDLDASAPNLCL
jgi:hypothetical protein